MDANLLNKQNENVTYLLNYNPLNKPQILKQLATSDNKLAQPNFIRPAYVLPGIANQGPLIGDLMGLGQHMRDN